MLKRDLLNFEQSNANEYNSKAKSVQEYAYAEDRNSVWRKAMEDYHFAHDDYFQDDEEICGLFGVLDGHGGKEVVEYCVKSIPKSFFDQYDNFINNVEKLFQETIKRVESQLKVHGSSDAGTTACLSFLRKEISAGKESTVLHLANVGDSRAILISQDKFERISYDHKATDPEEIMRIEKSGGFVTKDRVGGKLALSRALGDFYLKNEGVISTPYYQRIELTTKNQYIVMATDGLWDVAEDQDVFEFVKKSEAQGQNIKEISEKLVSHALAKGSKDNVSVFILKLKLL